MACFGVLIALDCSMSRAVCAHARVWMWSGVQGCRVWVRSGVGVWVGSGVKGWGMVCVGVEWCGWVWVGSGVCGCEVICKTVVSA